MQDEYNFCFKCGWDLSRPKSSLLVFGGKLHQCPSCGSDEIEKVSNPLICPNCGQYLGFNRAVLDPRLIEIAKGWGSNGKNGKQFAIEVLELNVRTANSLWRYKLTPIEILALPEDHDLPIRQFAGKSYEALNNARNNWTPKAEG